MEWGKNTPKDRKNTKKTTGFTGVIFSVQINRSEMIFTT